MSSRATVAFGLLAVVAFLAVLFVAKPFGGTSSTDVDRRADARVETAREGDASVQPEGTAPPAPVAATAADEPPESEDGMLRVRVVKLPDRTPVEGAQVWLLRETEVSLRDGWAVLADPLGNGVTDAKGWLLLPWGDGSDLRRVTAQAPGLLAAEARVGGPEGAVVLSLSEGLTITGRTVDESGQGVPHVEVEARSIRRPWTDDERLAGVPIPGAESAVVGSGPEGDFVLTGLSPGEYRVRAPGDGFVGVIDMPASTARPLPGAAGIVASAGAHGVNLVVGAYALVVVRPRDAATDKPLVAPWVAVTVRTTRAEPRSFVSFAPRVRVSEDFSWGASTFPSDTMVAVPLPRPGEAVDAEIEVVASGYRGAKQMLRVNPDAVFATRVSLEREGPSGRGSLLVDCSRGAGVVRPGHRVLTFCRIEDGTRTHREGRRVEGEHLAFDDLPTGRGTVQVWDGLSFSKPVEVTLEEGKTVEAKVEWPEPTGATFVLTEKDGTRVFDADLLVVAGEGQERGLPNRAEVTRVSRNGDRVLPLEPGRYRFAVNKRGQGYAAGSFEVREGSITRVVARLGPIPQDPALASPRPR